MIATGLLILKSPQVKRSSASGMKSHVSCSEPSQFPISIDRAITSARKYSPSAKPEFLLVHLSNSLEEKDREINSKLFYSKPSLKPSVFRLGKGFLNVSSSNIPDSLPVSARVLSISSARCLLDVETVLARFLLGNV